MSAQERPFVPVRIAVLTVSDTRGPQDDRSGDLLAERLTSAGHILAARDILPAVRDGIRVYQGLRTVELQAIAAP